MESLSITTDALRRRRVRSRMRTRLALTQRRGTDSDTERRGTHCNVDRPIDVLASAILQARARASCRNRGSHICSGTGRRASAGAATRAEHQQQ